MNFVYIGQNNDLESVHYWKFIVLLYNDDYHPDLSYIRTVTCQIQQALTDKLCVKESTKVSHYAM